MAVKDDVKKVKKAFEAKYPKLKGTVYLTSGNRTWRKQLDFILERDNAYKNIKRRFKKKFKAVLEKANLHILMEKVKGNSSIYGVSIKKANVFHIYK